MVRGAKKLHALFHENCLCVLFAAIVCSVLKLVHRIARACGPSNMSRIYATTHAAIMCCVPKMGRARSVDNFTDPAMHTVLDSVNSDAGVTAVVDGIRPQNAFVGLRGYRGLHEFERAHSARRTHYLLDGQ